MPGRDDISICTMYMPESNQSIDLHIEDGVPMLNSAVVVAAVRNPCYPVVTPGDYRLETSEVNAKASEITAPHTSSPAASPRVPKPHQARPAEIQQSCITGIHSDFFAEVFAGTAGLAGQVKIKRICGVHL